MNKKRKTSIELLRILMMLQVVFLHFSYYGGYTNMGQKMPEPGKFFYWFFWLLSRSPVYMFILIMGYFMCESEGGLKKGRLLKIYLSMMFYSVTITFLFGIFKPKYVNIYLFIKSVFPFMAKTWYFMTLYVLVLVLSPYINKLIKAMDKKEHMILIGIFFFIFCIWQQLTYIKPFSRLFNMTSVVETSFGKSLYDFIFMYLLGAFLRKYRLISVRKGFYLAAFVLLGLVNVLLVYIYKDPGIKTIVSSNDNLIAVLQCICLFRFFEGIEQKRFKKSRNVINYISAGNLGVYMIHDHPLVRKILWESIIRTNYNKEFYSNSFLAIKIIGIVFLIYAVCWTIDLLRRFLVGRIL